MKATAATRQGNRAPEWFANGFLIAAGFILIITVVPSWSHYFARRYDPASMLTIPIAPGLDYAALLVLMAVALRRRLRVAWWLMLIWWLIVPEIGRIASLVSGFPDIDSAGYVIQIAGLLLMGWVMVLAVRTRSQFTARRVPGNLGAAAAAFVIGGLLMVAIGTVLVVSFGNTTDPQAAAWHVFRTLLGDIGRIGVIDQVRAPFWVRLVIGLLGAVVVLTTAYLLFRPPRNLRLMTAADEARVRILLRDFGDRDSLGYFATRRDKAMIWDTGSAATARAGVSYRAVGAVSLASGNPVGDPLRWPAAIAAWQEHARSTGLSVAVMGAGTTGASAFAAAGLTPWEIGDEAIIDLRNFSLNAPGLGPVRQAVTRVQRRGYTTIIQRHRDLSRADFSALGQHAAAWRGDGGDERGFSMALGRLADPLDGDCVLVQVHDAAGGLRAFLSLVPWGRTALSLDLMRRDPTADNGLVELMVAALAERSARLGVAQVSLNFAMFREAFERGDELGAGPIARIWQQALRVASRSWQLESLYRANAKYLPDWQPRFICFEYAADLLRVGTAAGSAEGFLTRPRLSSLLPRTRPADRPSLSPSSGPYADEVLALIPSAPDPLDAVLATALAPDRQPEQVRVRRAKLDRLLARGIEPYPATAPRTHSLAEVRAEATKILNDGDATAQLPPDAHTGQVVSVTGRLLHKRKLGRIGFGTLRDGSGDLQVLISAAAPPAGVGANTFEFWRHDLDLGDQLSVTGEVITSRSGELSVAATSIVLTAKALRPLPDKRRGLTDPQARVRSRHLDLVVRPQARQIAYARSTVVRSLRDTLHQRGFIEVETPVLQLVHGGANARPFQTHSNAYNLDLYLRIATELHLKRLVIGGLESVFEIGRQFRNEGADSRHNPEFTSLEAYQTYTDYHDLRRLTQTLIQEAATAVYGQPVARHTDSAGRITEFDLAGDWPVITLCEAVSTALDAEITADTPQAELLARAVRRGLDLDPMLSWGPLLEEIYSQLCEPTTTTPVFYTDFPKENAPLARTHRADPRLAEKWDLVIFGSEQGTAYTELTDPVEQRARLVAQSLLAAAGDPEAMQVDEDFLAALEQGMPPTGGLGLGVDRLVMNLTGLGIRDTILFPLVKPER